MQARVYLIEQQDLATAQGSKRRPDERKPRLRLRRLFRVIEGQLLSVHAVDEPQPASWLYRRASIVGLKPAERDCHAPISIK